MQTALSLDDQRAEHCAREPTNEIAFVQMSVESADALMAAAKRVCSIGGPDAAGAAALAKEGARSLAQTLTLHQQRAIVRYQANAIAAIVFTGLATVDDTLPDMLPNAERLARDESTLEIASRSQVLLALLGERAFAYDVENDGRIVRLVGNFLGGGRHALRGEKRPADRRSSHHGGLLGAHTEGPYHSSRASRGGHSPSPSTLILSARWNPACEPTSLVPLRNVLDRMSGNDVLGLVVPCFGFMTSNSYVASDESPTKTALLDVFEDGNVHIRMNVHRAFVDVSAPPTSRHAFDRLQSAIARSEPTQVVLSSEVCVAIRNTRCLHGRDSIVDNRRLLVRLFGYSEDVSPVVLINDPLIVRG